MIDFVTAAERTRFAEPLRGMHFDRKRVFVDKLGWEVPVLDGAYEIDEFDNERAVYLLALDADKRRHLGSIRLLPTTGPHLLSEVFADLCDGAPPRGPDIWEITRYCTSPDVEDPRPIRGQLMMSVVEFALLHGISRYTAVTHMGFMSQVLAIGWECEPLGLPRQIGSQTLGALSIRISPATLAALRAKSVRHAREIDAMSARPAAAA